MLSKSSSRLANSPRVTSAPRNYGQSSIHPTGDDINWVHSETNRAVLRNRSRNSRHGVRHGIRPDERKCQRVGCDRCDNRRRTRKINQKLADQTLNFSHDMDTIMNKTQHVTLSETKVEDVLERLAVVHERQSHHLPVLDTKMFGGDTTAFYACWEEIQVNVYGRAHMSEIYVFAKSSRRRSSGERRGYSFHGSRVVRLLSYIFSRYGNAETIGIDIMTQFIAEA